MVVRSQTVRTIGIAMPDTDDLSSYAIVAVGRSASHSLS